jgi:hypothetical protein
VGDPSKVLVEVAGKELLENCYLNWSLINFYRHLLFKEHRPPPDDNGGQNGIHCHQRAPKSYEKANNNIMNKPTFQF